MKALLCFYCVLYFVSDCCGAPQVPKQSLRSSSLIGNQLPVEPYIDIPWLVSIPGNCQGIVLTPWLILSTANCLKKTKLSHLDISGVNNPDSIPHGQRICLHPNFDPQEENDPVKADIGLFILEEPIYGDEIPLSQSPNISLKSCSKCQYRSCDVYEYQSSKKLGTTRVKKIDVQLLDFSTCYHQHSYLEKTEGLCIQSQPREDCWVQRASPVLCLLKNRWELVGLIQKTSRICQNPTVIIRTAPYFAWMKQFIKASKRLLNPTSSLHCRKLQENEHVPQIRHSHNYISTLGSPDSTSRFLQGNIDISPQTKHIKDVPTIFNFSHVNSVTDGYKLLLKKSQTSQAASFLPKQAKSLPVARLPQHSEQNLVQYHQVTPSPNAVNLHKNPLSQLFTDTAMPYTTPKANTAKPWHFVADIPDESFDKIMADIIQQWNPFVDDGREPANSLNANTTDDSWTDNSTNLEEYKNLFKAIKNGSQNQYTTQTNLAPELSFSGGPWEYFNSGRVFTKTGLPLEPPPPPVESIRIPQPSGTIEPWGSSSDYNASSQDQSVLDLLRAQNHPESDSDRLQPVPMVNIGKPSTSKVITSTPLPIDLETKNPPYEIPYSTQPSQGGQSLLKAIMQPTVEVQP